MIQKLWYFLIITTLYFSSCKNPDFKILNKYNDPFLIYFVYTNSSDSLKILNYSRHIQNDFKGVIMIYFCSDSLKTPTFHDGKIVNEENSFACYSNVKEFYSNDISRGHLSLYSK